MFIKASGSGLYTKTIFCTFELENCGMLQDNLY